MLPRSDKGRGGQGRGGNGRGGAGRGPWRRPNRRFNNARVVLDEGNATAAEGGSPAVALGLSHCSWHSIRAGTVALVLNLVL